ncbi:hypothetical protein DFH07DRAFT_807880 [Mycena maculata]|uniref:HNH nuclease domain-containing protein n=1 Tax=Mycena maculata TaxID=230809 RepID=A0AAD7JN44_9AGAR|nr:hypothetical protein DFH07DRAFT_807880 [Mycena maculata]
MSLWTPTHESECILPLGSRWTFLNEEQRNVYIWNSRPASVSPTGQVTKFKLLASLWVDDEHQSLETVMLYRWLRSMCTPDGSEPIRYLRDPTPPDHDFCLLRLAGDPRAGVPFPVANDQLQQFTPVAATPNIITAGHYIMAGIRQVQGRRFLKLGAFQTHHPVIATRIISRSGTRTGGIPRNDATRASVRIRDLKCRVTGQPAPPGSRGYNFVGLEVAHIFPLGAVEQFRDAFTYSEHRVPLYNPLGIATQPRVAHIDIPENALLLRGDVHAQFDAYQFAFELSVESGQFAVPRIRLFEKYGAPSIPRNGLRRLKIATNPPDPNIPRSPNNAYDVSPFFLAQHFMTALLWHVAGNGVKGQNDAIIPAVYDVDTVLLGHQEC